MHLIAAGTLTIARLLLVTVTTPSSTWMVLLDDVPESRTAAGTTPHSSPRTHRTHPSVRARHTASLPATA